MRVQSGDHFNLEGIREAYISAWSMYVYGIVSPILRLKQFRGAKDGPCNLHLLSVCTGLGNLWGGMIHGIESPGTRAVPLVLSECLKPHAWRPTKIQALKMFAEFSFHP